jgi:2-hydroxymuconate-semialdehyde hydrolase
MNLSNARQRSSKSTPNSNVVVVDQIRTHYWSAGDPRNPVVVMLHGGEFGASAELSFEKNLEALAEVFYVLAPDMIGFGLTDKIVEFGLRMRHERRIRHITQFLHALGVEKAHFVGNSVGGSLVFHDLLEEKPLLPVITLTSICGAPPNNEPARNVLQAFDGSRDSMKAILKLLLHDARWLEHDYVERRYQSALIPGAFEAAAAARLSLPSRQIRTPSAPSFAAYARIRTPMLLITGAHDQCCPGWSEEAANVIPGSRLEIFNNSAHCAQLEEPSTFNAMLIDFISSRPTAS